MDRWNKDGSGRASPVQRILEYHRSRPTKGEDYEEALLLVVVKQRHTCINQSRYYTKDLVYLQERTRKIFPERIESFERDQRAARIQGNTDTMPTPSENFFGRGLSGLFFFSKKSPPPFYF